VTVSSLDSGTVKDEQDQQQTNAAFQLGATVLNCFGQHAGKLSEIVHKLLVKISARNRKVAADKRRFAQICVYLRFIDRAVCECRRCAGA